MAEIGMRHAFRTPDLRAWVAQLCGERLVMPRSAKRQPDRQTGVLFWAIALVSLLSLMTVLPVAALQAAEPPVQRLTKSYFPKLFVTWSPDGQWLAYSRHHENRRAANKVLVGLRLIRSDGTDDHPALPEFESSVQIQEHPAFSPDGKQLLITGGGNDTGNAAKDIFIADIDPQFQFKQLRKFTAGAGVTTGEQADWSPDGLEVVVTTTSKTLWVFDAKTQKKRRLFQAAGQYCFQPAWSPDGEWIAFATDRDGNSELYKLKPDGTEITRLTDHPGIDCRPKWSPNGRWIAFVSNRAGREDLYLLPASGGEPIRLTEHAAVDDHPAWSPDGRSLAFVSLRDGGFDLYRMELPASFEAGPRIKPTAGLLLAENGPKAASTTGNSAVPKNGTTTTKNTATDKKDPLIAHFSFDDDQGQTARDRPHKLALLLSESKLRGKTGRQAVEFFGKPGYAQAEATDLYDIDTALTVSCWIRPEMQKENGYLVSKHGWNIYLGPDLIPRFETRNAANTQWETVPAKTPLPVGKWSHVAAVFDPAGQELRIFIDGKLSASQMRTDGKIGAAAGYGLELGCYVATRSQYYIGELDELRIYAGALSAVDLARLYEAERTHVGHE